MNQRKYLNKIILQLICQHTTQNSHFLLTLSSSDPLTTYNIKLSFSLCLSNDCLALTTFQAILKCSITKSLLGFFSFSFFGHLGWVELCLICPNLWCNYPFTVFNRLLTPFLVIFSINILWFFTSDFICLKSTQFLCIWASNCQMILQTFPNYAMLIK